MMIIFVLLLVIVTSQETRPVRSIDLAARAWHAPYIQMSFFCVERSNWMCTSVHHTLQCHFRSSIIREEEEEEKKKDGNIDEY